ncbi:protein ARMCX6 [Mesocricetus auratus]|uniref:Protein ARMCX6 n=1 Tax=Mesocricetus auratus TaxID=10036 RepID=A0A3Q0CVQ8_MESAU|nr:protein ARMCX6 [Mesocricetus auratus]XP_040600334.1 protein ARMCX6 [Mesocricetus auratus]XP_040600335.1 protein ARMCX6 [Mesocricetus auratus]XP_040600336.1 protein ARMCX6 [Mesocricetus auratus]XP_040600337.1 protein ARMCX6 [Mesocricetus auratus]XP_040600338.1 protein ARMCX6 [Mesocricetus auratus]
MGRAREMGWMAAGLMIGAGACYCMYKLTMGRNSSNEPEEEEDNEWDEEQDLDEEEADLWFDFTTMPRPWSENGHWDEPGAPGGTEDRHSGGGKANRAHPIKQRPFPYEHKNTWAAQSFKSFNCSLVLTESDSIQGEKLSTEPTNAGYSLSHNVSRHLASLSVVGNRIPTPQPTVREKALCVPENPNTSIGNQDQIKMYIGEVCRETVFHCCKSFLQQAGLSLLMSMTVINNMLAKSVADLRLSWIPEGRGCAKVQALEPLMGLSEKPVRVGDAVAAQTLFSFMLLYIRNGSREMLVEALSP